MCTSRDWGRAVAARSRGAAALRALMYTSHAFRTLNDSSITLSRGAVNSVLCQRPPKTRATNHHQVARRGTRDGINRTAVAGRLSADHTRRNQRRRPPAHVQTRSYRRSHITLFSLECDLSDRTSILRSQHRKCDTRRPIQRRDAPLKARRHRARASSAAHPGTSPSGMTRHGNAPLPRPIRRAHNGAS